MTRSEGEDPRCSRRQVLFGAAALAYGAACNNTCNSGPAPPPDGSPVLRGPHAVARGTLGVSPGTSSVAVPDSVPKDTASFNCPSGTVTLRTPGAVNVLVYYPALSTSYDAAAPIVIDTRERNYPLVLYAHAKRPPPCILAAGLDPALTDVTLDYTRAGFMLDHVASTGCVVAVPDLSGFTNLGATERAALLVALYNSLTAQNGAVFQNRLDMKRLLLLGHSTGGASCLIARGSLVAAGAPNALAMGLLAPAVHGYSDDPTALAAMESPGGLLVVGGTADHLQGGVDPAGVYGAAMAPRALVTISGANHFGYTDICAPDNHACAADDGAGTISRLGQQLTAAAYLGALVRRFAMNDVTVTPYLNGSRAMELATFGVAPNAIAVQADGM